MYAIEFEIDITDQHIKLQNIVYILKDSSVFILRFNAVALSIQSLCQGTKKPRVAIESVLLSQFCGCLLC